MSNWFVYLIRCRKGTLYTGITTDVARRFEEHSGGAKGAKALRGKGPLELAFSQQAGDRSQASKVEAAIKKLSKSTKEALVAGTVDFDDLFAEYFSD